MTRFLLERKILKQFRKLNNADLEHVYDYIGFLLDIKYRAGILTNALRTFVDMFDHGEGNDNV